MLKEIKIKFKKEPLFFDELEFKSRIELMLYNFGFSYLDVEIEINKGETNE